MSFEALLMLGVVGFYVYDSAMLLCANEIIFIRRRRQWRFACAQDTWLVLGRSPYLPNPLTPDSAMFRVYWTAAGRRSPGMALPLDALLTALAPLAYWVLALLGQFFVVLPLVLFWYRSGPPLLWVFGTLYLNIIVLLVMTYRNRAVLRVSNRRFALLAFESLACAPFALNILRKLSLQHSLPGDPVELARQLFDDNGYGDLADAVVKRVDAQLEIADPDSPGFTALQTYKTRVLQRTE